MGKFARRFRKQFGKPLELTKLKSLPGVHGCEACRGESNRRELIASFLTEGKLGTWLAKCPICGHEWKVQLYTNASDEVLASFSPSDGEPDASGAN